jgi:ring-1,2-phenylacetyl-CoA epoxidase subunit PaaE
MKIPFIILKKTILTYLLYIQTQLHLHMQFFPISILDIDKALPDTVCITFDIPKPLQEKFAYIQGQYLTIKATINNIEVRRNYSLCSSPLENSWKIAIKKVDGGVFSTYANDILKKGDTLELLPPNGRFFTPLHKDAQKNYVAFAAGSGITPILSIIKTTLAIEPNSQFTLVYGNKNRNTILFKAELEALKNIFINRLQIIHILSREQTEIPLQYGRIDIDKCNAIVDKLLHKQFIDDVFICGPEEMILMVKDFFTAYGLPEQHIHVELFGVKKKISTVTIITPTNSKENCTVNIIKDNSTLQFNVPINTNNVLDIALLNNIDLPYACKGGVCCTCKAKLLEGNVTMEVHYGLEPDEIEAGYILTCQAVPTSETVTISFDEA